MHDLVLAPLWLPLARDAAFGLTRWLCRPAFCRTFRRRMSATRRRFPIHLIPAPFRGAQPTFSDTGCSACPARAALRRSAVTGRRHMQRKLSSSCSNSISMRCRHWDYAAAREPRDAPASRSARERAAHTRRRSQSRFRAIARWRRRLASTAIAAALPHTGRRADALAAGDWVLAFVAANGQCWLTARVPPLSAHHRGATATGAAIRVVSNVDVAFLVMGLDDDFNPRRLERFLALVWDPSIVKVVVLTKADVVASRDVLDERCALLRGRLPPTVPIVAVDATAMRRPRRCAPYVAAAPSRSSCSAPRAPASRR